MFVFAIIGCILFLGAVYAMFNQRDTAGAKLVKYEPVRFHIWITD